MKSIKLPTRDKKGHKGTFGTVAVFGGHISEDSVMLGSAVFAGKAALKNGAGIVDFVADQRTLVQLIEMLPQAIGHTPENLQKTTKMWQSIVVGPGWEESDENVKILEKILRLEKPTVIDGTALNLISFNQKLLKLIHSKCVLTPHIGEFKRLSKAIGIDDPTIFTQKYGCVLVLKSNVTTVTFGNDHWEHRGDNPVLATGGTGDVLAGLIGGFMAQYYPKLTLFEISKAAVETHAAAGKKWQAKKGDKGLIIDELIGLIS